MPSEVTFLMHDANLQENSPHLTTRTRWKRPMEPERQTLPPLQGDWHYRGVVSVVAVAESEHLPNECRVFVRDERFGFVEVYNGDKRYVVNMAKAANLITPGTQNARLPSPIELLT